MCYLFVFVFISFSLFSERNELVAHILMGDSPKKKKYKSVTKMLTDDSIQIIPIKIKYAHHHMVLRSNFWLSDCDISFPGNKLVSGHHCTVEKDEGQVWLRDSRWV